jgi:hypothetical protein
MTLKISKCVFAGLFLFPLAASLATGTPYAIGQSDTSSLSGTITDSSGGRSAGSQDYGARRRDW